MVIKKIIAAVVATALVSVSSTVILSEVKNKKNINNYYATTLKIKDFDFKTDTILMEDSVGNIWEAKGIEDWELDDVVSALMYDNRTTNIYDDKIVSMRYSSWRIE